MTVRSLSGIALAANGSCTDASNTTTLDANAVDTPAAPRQDSFDDNTTIETLVRSGVQLKEETHFEGALHGASARGSYIAVERLLPGAVGSFTPETTRDPLQVALFSRKQGQAIATLKDYHNINKEVGTYSSALQAAIVGGDVNMVQLVVQAGADLTVRGQFGYPLRAAVAFDHFHIARYLLEQRIDPNVYDEELGDAVQTAASKGNADMIKLLLSYGADVNGRGGDFDNALQAVCYHGNEQIAKLLLDNGAKMTFPQSQEGIIEDRSTQRGRYHNALHAAIHGGHERVVNLLINHEASVQVCPGIFGGGSRCGKGRYVPLPRGSLPSMQEPETRISRAHHYAALPLAIKLDSSSLIECLLAPNHSFGSVGYRMLYGDIRTPSHPLEVAAYWGSLEATKYLLKRGYNANTRVKTRPFLHIALERSQFHVADELLSQGAEIDRHWHKSRSDRDVDYGSCLQIFSETGNHKVIEYLLEKGADVNDSGGNRGTALQVACSNGHIDVVKLLLDRGADVHDSGRELGNALAAASGGGHKDIVLMLLDCHAEPNSLSGRARRACRRKLLGVQQRTALQAASASGRPSTVLTLLEHGAYINGALDHVTTRSDVEDVTICSCSPLMLASWYGHLEVVLILLQHGADTSLISSLPGKDLPFYKDDGMNGTWPLEVTASPTKGDALLAACSRGFVEIARHLFMADPLGYIHSKRFAPALAASLSRHRTSTNFESDLTDDQKELTLMLLRQGIAANLPLEEFGPVFEHGDISLVEALVEGRSLTAYPLLLLDASRGGRIQTVTILLSSGMNVNATDGLGRSALELAINELKQDFSRHRAKGEVNSRFDVFSTLLGHGADASKLTEKCHVVTNEIVERGRLDILLRLEAGGCRMFPRQQDLSSALTIATSKAHVDIVGHMIDLHKPGDAEIDRALRSLGDPGSSAQQDEVRIAELLLAARSSRVVRILRRPLARAANNKYFSLCHTLITEADQNRESYINILKDTATVQYDVGKYIHLIWRRVDARPDKLLIYNSAIREFTQCMGSSYTCNYSLLHMLLQGADSNIRGRSGESLLYHAAACQGQEERVKLFLHFRADMKAFGGEHGTALHGSAVGGSQGPMKVLLNAGANANALNEALESPLVLSLRQTWLPCRSRDDVECIHCCARLLIEAGADITIRCGEDGTTTPASAAIAAGNIDGMRMLLDNGVDVLEGMGGPDKIKDACEAAGLCQQCRKSLCRAFIRESKACTHMLDLFLSLGLEVRRLN